MRQHCHATLVKQSDAFFVVVLSNAADYVQALMTGNAAGTLDAD
jgi:hypothetical protein